MTVSSHNTNRQKVWQLLYRLVKKDSNHSCHVRPTYDLKSGIHFSRNIAQHFCSFRPTLSNGTTTPGSRPQQPHHSSPSNLPLHSTSVINYCSPITSPTTHPMPPTRTPQAPRRDLTRAVTATTRTPSSPFRSALARDLDPAPALTVFADNVHLAWPLCADGARVRLSAWAVAGGHEFRFFFLRCW